MKPLQIYIGWDAKESTAWHVLCHSILRRSSMPMSITPLVQNQLRRSGLYTRQRGPLESTAFSFTRFLVPYLCGYQGLALYMDCDMLCLEDLHELWCLNETPSKAVSVVKHEYCPSTTMKMDNRPQTIYPRKNWSSLMMFDNAQCRILTPEYINTASGLELHRFVWLQDSQIGALPFEWNYLVGEGNQSRKQPKIIHYTNGLPILEEYRTCEYGDLWWDEYNDMVSVK